MSHRHVICLVVDGLRASALGAYGNTTYPTPQFDSLASRALVADRMLADSPQLEGFYRSAWQGVHAMRPEVPSKHVSVLDQLRQADVLQWLVTDEPWLIEQSTQLPFDEALLFETGAEAAAEQIEETAIGRFFAEAVEQLHQWREDVAETSSMAWLHCRGLYGPWDAPTALREALLDDEDPSAADFLQPPTALREIEDPDILLMHRVVYAAQIAVLDACVGAFVQAVEAEFADSETLVMLTSSRGLALGEHGAIGTECEELYSERLHLPWMMYRCGNTTPLPRLGSLTQPADIAATLLDWLGVRKAESLSDGISCLPALSGLSCEGGPREAGPCEARQLAVATGHRNERVLYTPAWMLRQTDSTQLYTKPDDRWERNDVAGLCSEVVEGLQQELASFEKCCQESHSLPLSLKDSELAISTR